MKQNRNAEKTNHTLSESMKEEAAVNYSQSITHGDYSGSSKIAMKTTAN